MNMNIKIIIICMASLLVPMVSGCSSDDPQTTTLTTDSAKTRAKDILGGGIPATSESTTEAGVTFFSVTVTMPNGATVLVEILPNGDLREIKDFKGPFDYEIAAIPGVLTLPQAKEKALAAKPGTVVAWKYEVEDGKKIYEFYVRDVSEHLFEIKLDAVTGAITSIEEKAAID